MPREFRVLLQFSLNPFFQGLGEPGDPFFRIIFEPQVDQTDKWRVVHLPAQFKLLLEESGVVLPLGHLDTIVGWVIGLNEHFSRQVAPSRPPGDLGEELEGTLGGPKIGEVQGEVCGQNTDQGNPGKVMPFGDHLGSHEEIHLSPSEPAKDFLVGPLAGGGVAVHADHRDLGQHLFDLSLQTLRSAAEEEEAGGGALGAAIGGIESVVAVMAAEGPVRQVVDQGDAAVGAPVGKTAIPAKGKGGKTPPVQEEKGLLPPGHGFLQGLPQGPGEEGSLSPFPLFGSHVQDPNLGKRPTVDSVGQR